MVIRLLGFSLINNEICLSFSIYTLEYIEKANNRFYYKKIFKSHFQEDFNNYTL